MTSRRVAAACAILAALVVGVYHVLAAPGYSGQVRFGGLPVPGATVTASSGDRRLVTGTNEQAACPPADVDDGACPIGVEMLGVAPVERNIVIGSAPAGAEPSALGAEPY